MQADEIRLTPESVLLNLSINVLSRGYPDAVKVEVADAPLEGCCSFKAYKGGHRLSSTLSSRPKGAQPKSSSSRLPQIFGNIEAAKTLSAQFLCVLQSKTDSGVERVKSGRLSSDNQEIRTLGSLQIKFALSFDRTFSYISSLQVYLPFSILNYISDSYTIFLSCICTIQHDRKDQLARLAW